MSNTKVKSAHLSGYNGPFFPPALEAMHQVLYGKNSSVFSKRVLSDVGASTGMFVPTSVPAFTTDGYGWFLCLSVGQARNSGFVIAFPWAQDLDKSDDTRSDRHCAVYTYGDVSEDYIEEVINEFTEDYKAWAEENKTDA